MALLISDAVQPRPQVSVGPPNVRYWYVSVRFTDCVVLVMLPLVTDEVPVQLRAARIVQPPLSLDLARTSTSIPSIVTVPPVGRAVLKPPHS